MVSLWEIINSKLVDEDKISLQAVPERIHNCSIFDLFTLAALTRGLNPSLCLEIGTYDGRSALAIASNCNSEARVVTMNLPPNYLFLLRSGTRSSSLLTGLTTSAVSSRTARTLFA